mgnify:CR=1 FL=1
MLPVGICSCHNASWPHEFGLSPLAEQTLSVKAEVVS